MGVNWFDKFGDGGAGGDYQPGTSVYESHGGPVEFTDQSLTGWMVIMMLFYELN